ncbi:uncharacterized protein LOC129919412 [Episyrphus balteatus]|uniref:uncharacterized protein LOC129919412 n=1 Tax=Episyrphus balteatus TaxID=286459 RepID=UPI002485D187|nr:uncharacterized protein LOC129919412 [Episyrphus balteatus]
MDVEKLILCVRKYPILYDMYNSEYKNLKQKDQIWDEIGEALQESGEELKKKWKNLRDCYARYLRSWDMKASRTAPYNTRYYKFWPWAKQMDIFKPYLRFAKGQTETDLNESNGDPTTTSSNAESLQQIKQEDDDNDTQYEIEQPIPTSSRKRKNNSPPSAPPTPPASSWRKRKSETENSVDKVLKFLKQKRKKSETNPLSLNATEHMFLSFAKTIDTFSPRRQASIKMRITNMVLEEELLEKEEQEGKVEVDSNENDLQPTISSIVKYEADF